MNDLPLAGLRVLELGSRLAAGACGRLLADLGATVFVAEPRAASDRGKWVDRALATAGKRSVLCDPARLDDLQALLALAGRCHVVLACSDTDALPPAVAGALAARPIFCDITAFGSDGPLAGQPADELAIQAMSGLMDTTGFPDGPPVPLGVPVVELSTALYAAAAVTMAWRVLRRDGYGQRIELALFDTAINALTTFLPAHFAGRESRRLGNGHSMGVPWNAYRAADGWVLICSANDAQWRKLAALIDPALPDHPRFATLAGRLEARAEVDALVAGWVARRTLEPLVEMLAGAGIACGPIVPVDQLPAEPNLALRGLVAETSDPVARRPVRVPGGLVRMDGRALMRTAIAAPDDGRAEAAALPTSSADLPPARMPRPPFAGLRVLEIGQFTTAPLAARHLASFGADVIKIEPADGDSARAWAPHRQGTSHFFVMSNGEKRSLALDLRAPAGLAEFTRLLATADVLVENMKPGSLERLGFDEARLRALNPRLVYCAISGFGAHAAYPGRPAFDTVVQAMCGMMDATRAEGVPLKSGISAADIGGAQAGTLAIAAALVRRDRTGRGAMIDIAMQDVGAWFTQMRWNAGAAPAVFDGPVATVAEASAHAQTVARGLIERRADARGTEWELLRSPLRLARTPARTGTPIGAPQPGPMDWREAAEAQQAITGEPG